MTAPASRGKTLGRVLFLEPRVDPETLRVGREAAEAERDGEALARVLRLLIEGRDGEARDELAGLPVDLVSALREAGVALVAAVDADVRGRGRS